MFGAAFSFVAALLSYGTSPQLPGMAEANRCAAVTVREGRVVDAAFYRRMVGFAAQAGTSGGLGRRQLVVWRPEDGDQPGTLRHAMEAAERSGGGWISFAPELAGRTVRVERPLRPGNNLTIDGGCVGPRLVGVGRGSLFHLRGASNVVLSRLYLTQTGGGPIDGDCVSVSHGSDRVWVANNQVRSCKDGLVDVTRPGGRTMRVTISGNDFRDHDKAILIAGEPGSNACFGPPAVQVTLFRNSFYRTGQRHPRVAGSAFVHAAQNRMRFAPYGRGDGSLGGSSGIAASEGGRVLAEDLLFEPQGGKRLRLTSLVADAPGLPACRRAAIRVERASGPERADSFLPDLVARVPYTLPPSPPPGQLARLLEAETGPDAR